MSMFDELRKRHILQIGILYLGAGWLCIEITDFIVGTYGFSRKVLDVVVLLAILGFPSFLIIGWYHGEKGHQRVQRTELWLLLTLGVMGGIGTYRIATGESVEDEGEPVAAAAAPDAVGAEGDARLARDDEGRLRGPSLAVLPLQNNVADPDLDWLGPGLADLLTTNFAQVPGLQVVGRQRLYDLLTEEGRSEEEAIPESLASSVARAAGAQTMLRGSVSGTASDLVVDAQIVDVETGAVRAAQRVRGSDVFALVDSLSSRLIERSLPSRDVGPRTFRLSAVGTRDMEALESFQHGISLERQGKHGEAEGWFERAAEHDSAFLLPLVKLAARDRPPPPLPGEDPEAREAEARAAVLAGAEAVRRARWDRARALEMVSRVGEDVSVYLEGRTPEEFVAHLDSTLRIALSGTPELELDFRTDSAVRRARPGGEPIRPDSMR